MSRKRSKAKPRRTKRKRRKAKSIAQLFRGLVLEGTGFAVLLMLYFTIQATSGQAKQEGQKFGKVDVLRDVKETREQDHSNGGLLLPPHNASRIPTFPQTPNANASVAHNWR